MALNEFLKMPETITILPAAELTRLTTDIVWYEVQMPERRGAIRIVACNRNGDELERIEGEVVSDFAFKLVFYDDGRETKSSTTTITRDGTTVTLETTSGDGGVVTLSGEPGKPETLRRRERRKAPAQLPSPADHWATLYDPLLTLADALKMRAYDGRSWGCAACVVLDVGIGVGAYACFTGSLPACAGALYGGATFIQNCEGACASA